MTPSLLPHLAANAPIWHTMRGRPPCAATLARRAEDAVSAFRASRMNPAADLVTLRGRAIEACLEAALAPHGQRARWTLEAERIRATEPSYEREMKR